MFNLKFVGYGKEVGIKMCKAFEDNWTDGFKKGFKKGFVEGFAEGFAETMSEKYRFKVLFELVDDGLIQSDVAAKYMNITETAFKEKMANFAY